MTDDDRRAGRRWLVGPEDGATRLLLRRQEYKAGAFAGLHTHDGEEVHVVLSGAVRFTVDRRHIVCGDGEAAVAPPGAEHGFLVLDDATMLTVREQRLGTLVTVLEPDGSQREVEIYRGGPPWSKEPPEGSGTTPDDLVRDLYRTTHHLL